MNRLILVGNGFDRYLELNTDYPSLLKKVLYYIINELNPLGENILMKVNEDVKADIDKSYKNGKDDFFNELLTLKNNNKIEIKSKFLEELIKQIEKEGWCDYETIMKDEGGNAYEHKCIDILDFCFISEIELENKRKSAIKTYTEKVNEIARILNLNEIINNIDETIICNFNYTDTFEDVAEQIEHRDLLYIHGNLKNKETCIFGYYLDDKFRASFNGIDDINEKYWMQKDSITIERETLGNFASFDDFELFIIGLSCGESDELLLQKKIFGSKKCRSVKVMRYDKKGYDDIVRNIKKIYKDLGIDIIPEIRPIDYPK